MLTKDLQYTYCRELNKSNELNEGKWYIFGHGHEVVVVVVVLYLYWVYIF